MSDEYQVSGMKSWVITKLAKYLAVKEIDQEDIAELVKSISQYFTDKHEYEILHSLDIILCKLLMGIRHRFKEMTNGQKAEKAEEGQKDIVVERKKGPRRKKGRDCRP